MKAKVTLAIIYHDPQGRLYRQLQQTLPFLSRVFDDLVVQASPLAWEPSLALLTSAGARVQQEAAGLTGGIAVLGRIRRAALALALRTEADFILACDGDRSLHWAERYPEELVAVVRRLPDHDFTVIGRTGRAFASHPRSQVDTERLVNQLYARLSGYDWDITAAARGLSRPAAEAIVAGCHDDTIGVDAAWPLFIQQVGGFSLGYIATEGLEFETADRYRDEVAASGDYMTWLSRRDADPRQWALRLQLAALEMESMVPYAGV